MDDVLSRESGAAALDCAESEVWRVRNSRLSVPDPSTRLVSTPYMPHGSERETVEHVVIPPFVNTSGSRGPISDSVSKTSSPLPNRSVMLLSAAAAYAPVTR